MALRAAPVLLRRRDPRRGEPRRVGKLEQREAAQRLERVLVAQIGEHDVVGDDLQEAVLRHAARIGLG